MQIIKNKPMKIKIKLLPHYVGSLLPSYATNGSAGIDLIACFDTDILIIKPGSPTLVGTGISLSLPENCYADIRPRSGLSLKHLHICNSPGTIDSDYRGEIKVLLANHSSEDFLITKGMRIAQMIIMEFNKIEFVEYDELDETERGEGGFGSTGA